LYPFALTFGILVGAVIGFPTKLIGVLNDIASGPTPTRTMNRVMKVIFVVGSALFILVMTIWQQYISIVGLFTAWAVFAAIAICAYVYVFWKATRQVNMNWVLLVLFAIGWATWWGGGLIAQQQAFDSNSLYTLFTKDSVIASVRIARTSSSGFLVTQNKKIIFVPIGEIKSVVSVDGW
jgi:hypothetical protein